MELITKRAIERRAVEVVIWGMPVVNYDLMLQEMLTKTPGKVGQFIYWGRPLDWHNQTLTPNPDTLYFMGFFDTKDGPMVLEVPPGDESGSLNGNIVTQWQTSLEDVGLLGVDKGAGGKFVILPPGYAGPVPEGYSPLHSDTYGGYADFAVIPVDPIAWSRGPLKLPADLPSERAIFIEPLADCLHAVHAATGPFLVPSVRLVLSSSSYGGFLLLVVKQLTPAYLPREGPLVPPPLLQEV